MANQKGFSTIVGVVIGILVLGAVAFGVWLWWANQCPECPQPLQGGIANWKTFTNIKYGYQFKYPEDTSPKTRGFASIATGVEDFVAVVENGASYSLFNVSVQSTSYKSVEDFIKTVDLKGEVGITRSKTGERIIGGEQAIELLVDREVGFQKEFYFIHNDKLFVINHGVFSGEPAQAVSESKIFEAMLKSFEFTK